MLSMVQKNWFATISTTKANLLVFVATGAQFGVKPTTRAERAELVGSSIAPSPSVAPLSQGTASQSAQHEQASTCVRQLQPHKSASLEQLSSHSFYNEPAMGGLCRAGLSAAYPSQVRLVERQLQKGMDAPPWDLDWHGRMNGGWWRLESKEQLFFGSNTNICNILI